jgi:hypothetical protein
MLAHGLDSKTIIYLLDKQVHPNLPEERIRFHISRVKSDYNEFVDIMGAIIVAKYSEFIKMGASEKQASDCTDDWLMSELF